MKADIKSRVSGERSMDRRNRVKRKKLFWVMSRIAVMAWFLHHMCRWQFRRRRGFHMPLFCCPRDDGSMVPKETMAFMSISA
jgi:hypothetical protein